MFDLADVGGIAPALALRDAEEPDARHRPRLLAFVRAWSMSPESEGDLAGVRARLAQLDAELVVVGRAGAWAIVRDRAPVFCDRLDVAAAAAAYRVTADAVFVIDHRGVVRFAHRPDRPLSATLAEALDAAAEALAWRDHQTRLERVQWTPREWALKCLVVGCALTFVSGRPPVEPRRFARGTGPVVKYESRELITPRTETGAPSPLAGVGEPPRAPCPRRAD